MVDSSKHSDRLKNRKVLIFGGSSGLGYGTAEACVESGMIVVITSSSADRVNQAIQRILKEYPSATDRVSGHACDLGNQATLEDSIVELFEKVGTLDHIIYCAGDSLGSLTKPLDQIGVDSAVKSHMVRYFAPLMVGKHATKYLSHGPYSSITLTSGGITVRPTPNWILANGVMNALEGLAQALALDLAPIRVNVIQPGYVDSEMWSDMSEEDQASLKATTEKWVPTQRLAQPEDVAEAYLYTLKDPSLTGSVIKTDSGRMLK